ncbi:MAG: hypothetical protein WBQ95_07060 [Terracidiphilus sp.]
MALPLANPLRQCEKSSERIRAWQAPRALHLWHLASLDAPTVAVVWALAFANAAGVYLDLWVALLLACGTWTVYIGDRLLDAQRAIRSDNLDALRERHYFHWRHRRSLIPIACAAAAVAIGLVTRRMPVAVRSRDSVLAAAALMYFSGVHMTAELPEWVRKFVSKEWLVGLLFTAGCAAPTLSRLHFAQWPFLTCLALFVALAWLNCAAIESWESSKSQSAIFWRTSVLGACALAASGAFASTDIRASALACCVVASAFLLCLLDRTRSRISPVTLRTLADLVLLTPLIPVIIGAHQS